MKNNFYIDTQNYLKKLPYKNDYGKFDENKFIFVLSELIQMIGKIIILLDIFFYKIFQQLKNIFFYRNY